MNASNTDLAREQLIFTNFAYSQLVLCAIIYLILPFEVAGFIEFMYRSDRRDNVNRFYLRIGLFAGQITGAITVSVVLALAMHDQFDQSLCEDIAKFTL